MPKSYISLSDKELAATHVALSLDDSSEFSRAIFY